MFFKIFSSPSQSIASRSLFFVEQVKADSRPTFGSAQRFEEEERASRTKARFALRRARVARRAGPVGIDVERPRGALNDLILRSRPPRRLRGLADRTWCRAGSLL